MPTLAIVSEPTTRNVRACNRADQRRQHAIDNVVERLEFIASLEHQAERRRGFSMLIVDAVLALTRSESV